MAAVINTGRKTITEQLLSVITEVNAGEGSRTLLLGLNVFALMLSYYLLRVVRDPLILTEGGAEVKAYSSAWQALLLMAAVPAYAAFSARLNRRKLIDYVTLFFAANLLLFAAAGYGGAHVGVVFYVWVGIFNMMVIAQFWAFANDLYTEGAGKRLFPVIMLGASLGAIAGSQVAGRMFALMGAYGLMVLAAGILAAGLLITRGIHTRAAVVQRVADFPLGPDNVFQVLFKDRYLQLIALLMVILNFVNTNGEFLLDRFVTAEAVRAAADNIEAQKVIIAEFRGDVNSLFSVVGLLLQLFLVSRIFRYAGVGAALLILPVLAMTGYAMILAVPLLGVVKWVKIFENGTDYSIQNTARQALWLPTTREAKYKAKPAIDAFFVRTGDVLSACLVYAGTHWFLLSVGGFAAVNLAMTLAWLGVAAAVARDYRRRTQPAPAAQPASTVQGALA